MTPPDIDELARLVAAATPGPWEYHPFGWRPANPPQDEPGMYRLTSTTHGPGGTVFVKRNELSYLVVADWTLEDANARAIAALFNAAPALLSAARETALPGETVVRYIPAEPAPQEAQGKVERRHREATARALQPAVDPTWWIWQWVETGAVPSSHQTWVGFDQACRVAQALADAESRGQPQPRTVPACIECRLCDALPGALLCASCAGSGDA